MYVHEFISPILTWVYSNLLVTKGFITLEDVPPESREFFCDSNEARLSFKVIQSRFQLWSAHLRCLSVQPENITYPVHIYKQATQFRYNKQKGGLDKFTNIEQSILDKGLNYHLE